VIDLFAGPGGLSEGFSSVRDSEGCPVFRIALSIEKDEFAHRTLTLRSFFRHCQGHTELSDYYRYLRGDDSLRTLGDLLARHPALTKTVQQEVWRATLGEVDEQEVHKRVKWALEKHGSSGDWVLIGGPPCQAYSLVGRARMLGGNPEGFYEDERHTLYREYLLIIERHGPTVFVMENVKGLLSSRLKDAPIFRRILRDLQRTRKGPSYRLFALTVPESGGEGAPEPDAFVIRAELHGIPQARHRVIVLGVREDSLRTREQSIPRLAFEDGPLQAVERVLGDLPKLRSGLSRESDSPQSWLDAVRAADGSRWIRQLNRNGGREIGDAIKGVTRELRVPRGGRGGRFLEAESRPALHQFWFEDARLNGICNHESRGHIRSDLHRYLFAACYARVHRTSPRLEAFPPDLLPDHANVPDAIASQVFNDRFRVQLWGRPATTVTSHISKDGHYFIHPDPGQVRSLTVREAARIQTFPDNYFFEGPRTEQYRQVGNAVPPLLAMQIAEGIAEFFGTRAGRG
jgi:DNA (cytosine-5)-methyltransferase 1